MRLRPDLRMGVAGDEKNDDGYLAPDHYFAHDDHYAYDSTGPHPLPFTGRWRYSQLDAGDPWVLDAEHDSDDQAEKAITKAQEHATRHRVLDGSGPKIPARLNPSPAQGLSAGQAFTGQASARLTATHARRPARTMTSPATQAQPRGPQ